MILSNKNLKIDILFVPTEWKLFFLFSYWKGINDLFILINNKIVFALFLSIKFLEQKAIKNIIDKISEFGKNTNRYLIIILWENNFWSI